MDEWKVLKRDEDGTVTYFMDLGDRWAIKTETPVDALLDWNRAEYNASNGKQFGDGKVVARIPENLFYDKLVEPMRQRDRRWLKKFLNDADNRAFRTFRGDV
jgi:hypothetical protein